MLHQILNSFSQEVAVDFGTANTLLYVRGQGIVANEASFVAMHEKGPHAGKVEAFGSRAKELRGRTSSNVLSTSPLREGTIYNFDQAKALLRYFFDKIPFKNRLLRSKVVIGVPTGATELEQRAVIEAAEYAGAGQVFIVEEVISAAIGAGIPIEESYGSMVVDIGGGTTGVAVLSLNGAVRTQAIKTAGNSFDQRIADYVRRRSGIVIGEQSAEAAKIAVGAARISEENPTIALPGHNLAKSRPDTVTVSREDIVKAITEPLDEIVALIQQVLDDTPPEIAGDLIDSGIALVGGGALLPDIDLFLTERTGLPVSLAEEPLTTAIAGSGRILEDWEKYQHLLSHA